MSMKYLGVASYVILLYDHLLTFSDEVSVADSVNAASELNDRV